MARESRGLTLKADIKILKKNQCNIEISDKKPLRDSKEKNIDNEIKIFCNALETEPNYFKSFAEEVNSSKISDVKVEVLKTQKKGGKDPLYAVEYAIKNKGTCKIVWVVFDKDHFDIEKAIKLGEQNDIKIAWSNECFELWILFHFNPISTALGRDDCLKKAKELLNKNYKIDYSKNNKDIYKTINDKMKIAIAYSKKQHQVMIRDRILPNKSNPCNTVYELAEFLSKRIIRN